MSLQKIFFGPPGCGKSFRVRKVAIDELKIAKTPEDLKKSQDMIETAFHPEYGYGDFVAKLMPLTEGGHIKYQIHAGHLVKALARAYIAPDQEVLLVIDEINRGNCAQIFGDIFQLLDRDNEGWSEYGIDTSDLIKSALEQELNRLKRKPEDLHNKLEVTENKICKLRLPPNLNIIGTMNTSDESVYYMDTAFKRRWEFEFMPWKGTDETPDFQKNAKVQGNQTKHTWYEFLTKLNAFIADEFKGRNVDDKQVGLWFLKATGISTKITPTRKIEYIVGLPDEQERIRDILLTLIGKPKHAEWAAHSEFPDAAVFPDKDLNQKYLAKRSGNLACASIKDTLEKKFGKGFFDDDVFNHDPDDLALDLIKYIAIKKLAVRIDKVTETTFNGEPTIELSAIKNKLMFFLWDNVFSRDRTLLAGLLGKDKNELRTFGEFSSDGNVTAFIEGVMAWTKENHSQYDCP